MAIVEILPRPMETTATAKTGLSPYQFSYTVAPITNEVVVITLNGKRFTPADSWPEPITDRQPTLGDADENGDVQRLSVCGDWFRLPWETVKAKPKCGWARTLDWKPRPLDKKTLLLRDLRQARDAGKSVTREALDAAIELLEAT